MTALLCKMIVLYKNFFWKYNQTQFKGNNNVYRQYRNKRRNYLNADAYDEGGILPNGIVSPRCDYIYRGDMPCAATAAFSQDAHLTAAFDIQVYKRAARGSCYND